MRYYFKAKLFKFNNNYFRYYRKHNCLRMMDFHIAAFDTQAIRDLDIINFIHNNNCDEGEDKFKLDHLVSSQSKMKN